MHIAYFLVYLHVDCACIQMNMKQQKFQGYKKLGKEPTVILDHTIKALKGQITPNSSLSSATSLRNPMRSGRMRYTPKYCKCPIYKKPSKIPNKLNNCENLKSLDNI